MPRRSDLRSSHTKKGQSAPMQSETPVKCHTTQSIPCNTTHAMRHEAHHVQAKEVKVGFSKSCSEATGTDIPVYDSPQTVHIVALLRTWLEATAIHTVKERAGYCSGHVSVGLKILHSSVAPRGTQQRHGIVMVHGTAGGQY